MKLKSLLLAFTFVAAAPFVAHATTAPVTAPDNAMDELDPYDPNIDQILQNMDQEYEAETGKSAHLPGMTNPGLDGITNFSAGCVRQTCAVWAQVVKSRQKMYLYVNGRLEGTYATSTGVPGHGTPNFDTHPNGRIYDAYTSSKYPGGDYNGLGNMPYAVFISGGFAIHGTGQGNWQYLGRPASHGCIRIHPDNAYHFNRLVRQVGIANTWITVQD
jgi:hypothetical protein